MKYILSFALLFFNALPLQAETAVVLLGTGNPNPMPERSGPATAIVVGDKSYIFDAGVGLVRRAAEAAEKYELPALKAENLTHVFLTHLHSDHTLGMADVILTPWVMERSTPLQLFGPKGSKAMADHIIKAYSRDINRRIKGLQPTAGEGWQVNTREWTKGNMTYKDDAVTVEAFPVCHGLWKGALGYKITTADKVIVISGDTSYCPAIAEKASGADILIHEAYSEVSFKRLPVNWATYHSAYHTKSSDLAKIAHQTKPKLLVTYHQLTWGGDPITLVADEIKATYKGKVVTGRDLDIFR